MKKLIVFLGIALMAIGSAANAQEIPEISLDMRGGFNYGNTDGSGQFVGDGLYLDINGNISPHFSYSLNQRLASTYYEDNSGFNGTNWLTLTYETENFAFTAGKDAVFVGSFEYDAYDLDAYDVMNSAFYNEFDCWQWGVSAAWYPAEDHEFLFQISNSPLAYGEPNLYALAAGWRGSWGFYESYWTANLWQYDEAEFSKAFNMGNRFTAGGLTIDLDLMYRIQEFGEDLNGLTCTFAPSYEFGDWGRVFTKAGWDSTPDAFFYGAGVEHFPLKENKNIRLHAIYAHNASTIGNMVSLGITWKMKMN